MTTQYRNGIRVASAVASIVANATAVALHTMPATRTGIVRKISIFNRNIVATNVSIGTGLGVAFAALLPAIPMLAGGSITIDEANIPNVEFTANITTSATVGAAAPLDVQIQVEVEELMGSAA